MGQIEKLTTKEEILQFVRKVAPDYGSISARFGFRRIPLSAFDSLVTTYHLQGVEKADLDGNGLTDLIFNGSRYSYSGQDSSHLPITLAILSFSKDSFAVRDLSLQPFQDIAAHYLLIDGRPCIQTFRSSVRLEDTNYHVDCLIDTLVWEFGSFIEKRQPVKRRIQRIDYNSWNGLVFWKDIALRIIKDSVRLKKQRLEAWRGGVYLSRLDSATNHRLYGLLDAIDFVGLKDRYAVNVYDASTGNLKITYDDGQTKMISDYGTCGTYGLAELHQLFNHLGEAQPWVSADPVVPRCIDSLHCDSQVLGLVRTLGTDNPFLDFEADTPLDAMAGYQKWSQTFGEQKWQKGDIDANGHTDLLFNGFMNKDGQSRPYSSVVLSFGGDSLREQEISGRDSFFAAKIIRCNGRDVMAIRALETFRDCTQKNGYRLWEKQDTLTASDGFMVELPSPVIHHIEAIREGLGTGSDSIVVTPEGVHWYKNDADFSHLGELGAVIPKDSINLYTLRDPAAAEKLLSIAAGIRFERLASDSSLSSGIMQYPGSTWLIKHDGGKTSRLRTYGPLASYRLYALDARFWELKDDRKDWKFVAHIKGDRP